MDMQERINTLVSEGHRAIIFSQFVDTNYGILAIYQRLKYLYPLVFSGSLTLQEKDTIIRKFKSDPGRKVLILSLRAADRDLTCKKHLTSFILTAGGIQL